MKQLAGVLLACALVCAAALSITGCGKLGGSGDIVSDSSVSGSDVSPSAEAGSEFTADDTVVTVIGAGDVALGMTKDEVEAALGKPDETKQDEVSGEVWYYQGCNFEVGFPDDTAEVISAGALDDKTILLKSRGLYPDCTFDEVITAFYDNGRKEKIDFAGELKKHGLDYLLDEYKDADAYYLYGNLFDDSVISCGYVMQEPGEEGHSVIYNCVVLDEAGGAAGYYYTLAFDTYTERDKPERVGYLYLSREYRSQ